MTENTDQKLGQKLGQKLSKKNNPEKDFIVRCTSK